MSRSELKNTLDCINTIYDIRDVVGRFWNELEEQHTWKISVDELNNASVELGLSPINNFDKNPSLSVNDLKEWAMDVFYHPSRYVEVIRQIRDIYNSQCESTTASIN